ncbi:MAG TPA: methyltransferase domain-containing protein [Acidimicrobiales bacterium]|nr:methyltransferase domain-containing protein [Acidimicrobiales bacterium]
MKIPGGIMTVSGSEAAVVAARWDPGQYNRFADDRARPFFDLVSRVNHPGALDVVDLGCGPGNLTAELWNRWPGARLLGIDSSPEMLAAAAPLEVPGRIEFQLADVRSWEPDRQFDVIVSNATLHWVPGHIDLLERFVSWLAPGGVFAMQVPGNFGEPTHLLLHDLVASRRWHRQLEGKLPPAAASHDPGDYLTTLLGLGLSAVAWETTYFQVLQGQDAVLNWMRGTALRPVLTALGEGDATEFCAEYAELLRAAYPPTAEGTVLPFRRVFAVGSLGRPQPSGAVTGSDHTQLAMPAGREDDGRAFYCGLLGFVEIAKPPVLASRGGAWFKASGTEVHLGVDKDFVPARKAHVGLEVDDLDVLAGRLAAAGCRVDFDDELAPRRRLFTDDPFGNRVELLGPRP